MKEITEVFGKINAGLLDHWTEATNIFDTKYIVGLFLQGSQNYKLDTASSDIDSKLIVLPSFYDLAFNKAPVSTTHVMANNEHIDFKDIRLMFQTFRKQNINFIEILFTPYQFTNSIYFNEWNRLIEAREDIAHYNIYNTVKATVGMTEQKYAALEHQFPAKEAVLQKFGYDPKQLHHILRLEDFLRKYLIGKPYAECIIPDSPDFLKTVKEGYYDILEARTVATNSLARIKTMTAPVTKESHYNTSNIKVDVLLDDVQYNIMKQLMKSEVQ